jgi:DNA-binding MarR family transcriptional regulator
MSGVIEALEGKGLIERSPHPSHRRVLPAVLTARGRRVLRACDAGVDETEAEMLAVLGDRDRAVLRESLISAVRALHAGLPEH